MIKSAVKKNDLLFHPVHGLCRVTTITSATQAEELHYTLLPVVKNKGAIRFVVSQSALENSGFNKFISPKVGHAILDFFKTSKKTGPQNSQAWELALLIDSESSNKESVKDARKRHRLFRAVKGLARELAFVLNKPTKEIAETIQKNLGHNSEINPMVLTALANIDKD